MGTLSDPSSCQVCSLVFDSEDTPFLLSCLLCLEEFHSANQVLEHKCQQQKSIPREVRKAQETSPHFVHVREDIGEGQTSSSSGDEKVFEDLEETDFVDGDFSEALQEPYPAALTLGTLQTKSAKRKTATKTPDNRLQCDLCSATLKQYSSLWDHKKNFHASETADCQICKTTFKSAKYLRQHVRNMHSSGRVECDFCPRKFRNLVAMWRHRRRLHQEELKLVREETSSANKQRVLKETGRRSIKTDMTKTGERKRGSGSVEDEVSSKELVHVKEEEKGEDLVDLQGGEFSVEFGGFVDTVPDEAGSVEIGQGKRERVSKKKKVSSSKKAVVRKDDALPPKEMHKCPSCEREFRVKGRLYRHIIAHHPDLAPAVQSARDAPKECPHCDYTSVYQTGVRTHVRIVHDDAKDHVCHFCGKRFSMSYSLKDHMRRIHEDVPLDEATGKRLFPCVVCGQKCHSRNGLTKHRMQKHDEGDDNNKTFTCEICGLVCTIRGCLTKHLFKKHGLDVRSERTRQMREEIGARRRRGMPAGGRRLKIDVMQDDKGEEVEQQALESIVSDC